MKINNDVSTPISNRSTGSISGTKDRVSVGNKTPEGEKNESNLDSAKVSLSDRAQNIWKAKAIALNTPDVRKDKVEEIRRQIQSGQYKINDGAIADKMVDEALLEV